MSLLTMDTRNSLVEWDQDSRGAAALHNWGFYYSHQYLTKPKPSNITKHESCSSSDFENNFQSFQLHSCQQVHFLQWTFQVSAGMPILLVSMRRGSTVPACAYSVLSLFQNRRVLPYCHSRKLLYLTCMPTVMALSVYTFVCHLGCCFPSYFSSDGSW